MRKSFKKVAQKIGEVLYLAVSASDPNQDPITKARQYDFYQISQDKSSQRY
ncbi:hypothetical protein [Mariniplasma anaerobium]|uniref:Uncharacterized protein n=1 Tax=Mariniplasma anaerobium TaxID=2735436 RepID=A0A7U9XUT9_9MOLU|nr:hypothetical protein [Mariniplasma anaerobium]BCR35252.1 hypothetical protein MPAN_001450 [Mariniplasma anaerobium]